MASSGFVELNQNCKWYCHQCEQEVKPNLTDCVCSICGGGFIEPIQNQESTNDSNTRSSSAEVAMDTSDSTASEESNVREAILRRPMRRGIRGHTYRSIGYHFSQSEAQITYRGFLEELMVGLTGGAVRGMGGLNIQVAPLMMSDGLDNIITLLMNQADGAGPPPAQKDQIDALPSVIVVQEQVDKNLQCHVCMEDFQLEELVRSLPCHHIYHGDCIVPWLELHGTCPICRRTIDKVSNEAATEDARNERV